MNIDDLKIKWNEIKKSRGFVQRFDPTHPLDLFIGIDSNGLKELVLITNQEPSKLKSSKSIQVEIGRREDGQFAFQIKLIREEHEDVFAQLCFDLIEFSSKANDKLQGYEIFIGRFIKWQKLLESGSEGISNEVIKGLIGELKFAEEILFKRYNFDTVIDSWLGPNGADRDFVFEDTWVEVKTIASGKPTVCISSLNQLDANNNGFLAVATVDTTSESDQNGFSFFSLIEEFRSLLSSNPVALHNFEDKLLNLGYYDRKEYSDKYFLFNGFKLFRVDEMFPKLTSKNVRVEISSLKYELNISALSSWEVIEECIWN